MQALSSQPDPLLSRLDRLLDRLDQLESRLQRLESSLVEAPGLAATAINSLDAYFRPRAGESADLPDRLIRLLGMLEQLSGPDYLDTFERLLKHSDSLLPWLRMLVELPGMLGVSVDSFDEAMARLKAGGVDVNDRLQHLVAFGSVISEPHTVRMLSKLMQQRDSLQMLVDFVRDAPGIVSVVVDSGDELYRRYQRASEQLEPLLAELRGGLNPESLAVVASAGQALSDSVRDHQPAGALQLLQAFGQPEFRRSLGFLLSFGRHFSRRLEGPARGESP